MLKVSSEFEPGRVCSHFAGLGYEADAAVVASHAIKKASDEGYDVVLVDTAGRMQVALL